MAHTSLHDRLRGSIAKELMKELKISSVYALPHIEKVVVNVGINKSKMDRSELHEYIAESLAKITGQQPVFTKARQAISNFKTRKGLVVGAVVTLRGRHMEEFLDRLINYALPRIRDFRGLTAKFDGHGNYAIGIRDHSIFPEVPLPDTKDIFGMQIQIATTTQDDEQARALLKKIGMPFRSEKKMKEEEAEAKKAAEAQTKKRETEEAEKESTKESTKEADTSAPLSAGESDESDDISSASSDSSGSSSSSQS